jgi:hypothetical protein
VSYENRIAEGLRDLGLTETAAAYEGGIRDAGQVSDTVRAWIGRVDEEWDRRARKVLRALDALSLVGVR